MKSGPSLNGCTFRPRRRNALTITDVIVVFPAPLCVPAISTPRPPCSIDDATRTLAITAASQTVHAAPGLPRFSHDPSDVARLEELRRRQRGGLHADEPVHRLLV